MKEIQQMLFELQDKEYAAFQVKLTPGITLENVIGVRVPKCRELAKKLIKERKDLVDDFLTELPHQYYDENMLHGLILSQMKDYEKCVQEVNKFLPYVDNWAVCDIMSPKVFGKHKDVFIEEITKWIHDDKTYTIRFGIEMLMSFYLDEDFKKEYNDLAAVPTSEEYYVKMMIAWYFATALAKQWENTIIFIEEKKLETWTHNKTIQKAVESYRITDEQKVYLKSLKR